MSTLSSKHVRISHVEIRHVLEACRACASPDLLLACLSPAAPGTCAFC